MSVDVENKMALLITKDGLDFMRFNEESTEELTWESSTLRAWLGGEFFDTAFTDVQKNKILEVSNPADTNDESGIHGGNDTMDKVFILSATEMIKLFKDDADMIASFGGEPVSYWTRTLGNDTSGYVCTYSEGGGLYMTGNAANAETVIVRPAILVDVSNDIND